MKKICQAEGTVDQRERVDPIVRMPLQIAGMGDQTERMVVQAAVGMVVQAVGMVFQAVGIIVRAAVKAAVQDAVGVAVLASVAIVFQAVVGMAVQAEG